MTTNRWYPPPVRHSRQRSETWAREWRHASDGYPIATHTGAEHEEAIIASRIIETVARADGTTLAMIVFAMVLAESLILTDLLMPGEVGLVAAGAAAAHNDTAIGLVIAAASLGAVAGDGLGYTVGRRFGTDAVERWRWTRRLRPALQRARRHFERRGGAAVAVARWVGALRAVVPVVAGTAGMPVVRFFSWDLPSAVAWSTAVVTVGFVWGDDIAEVVDRIGLGISAAAIIAIVIAVLLWRRRRHSSSSEPPAHETDGANDQSGSFRSLSRSSTARPSTRSTSLGNGSGRGRGHEPPTRWSATSSENVWRMLRTTVRSSTAR